MTLQGNDLAGISLASFQVAEAAFKAKDYCLAIRLCQEIIAEKPDDVSVRLLAGRALAANRQYAEAEEMCADVLRREPRCVDAYVTRAIILLRQWRNAEAVQSCRDAYKISPDNIGVLETLGWALCRIGENEEARVTLGRAIAAQPDRADPYVYLCDALCALRVYDKALEVADRAVALDPNNTHAHSVRGGALTGLCKYDEALQACQRALDLNGDNYGAYVIRSWAFGRLEQPAEELAAAEEAIRLTPKNHYAWNNKADALIALKMYENALDAAEKAINYSVKYAKPFGNKATALVKLNRMPEAIRAAETGVDFDPGDAFLRRTLGWALVEERRFSEAIAVLESAIEIEKNTIYGYEILGRAYYGIGQPERAINCCQDGIAACGKPSKDILRNAAIYQSGSGRHQDAIEMARRVVALFPDWAPGHATLADMYCNVERFDDALAVAQTSVDLDPDDNRPHHALARVFVNLERFPEALRHVDRAIKLAPRDDNAYVTRAWALSELGRNDEALSACQDALLINPRNAHAYGNAGNALINLQRYGDAVDACRRGIFINPDLAFLHNNLAVALDIQGKHEEAAREYKRTLKLDPKHVNARNGLEAVTAKPLPYSASLGLAAWSATLIGLSRWMEMVEAESAISGIEGNRDAMEEHFRLGNLYFSAGRKADSLACYCEAAFLGHASAFKKFSSMAGKEAAALLDRFVEHKAIEDLIALAHLLEDRSHIEAALVIWRRAVALQSSDFRLDFGLIQGLLWLSQIASAPILVALAHCHIETIAAQPSDEIRPVINGLKGRALLAYWEGGAQPTKLGASLPWIGPIDLRAAHRRLEADNAQGNLDARLDEAVSLLRRATEEMAEEQPQRPIFLGDLARGLFSVFLHRQDEGVIAEARDVCRRMIERGDGMYLREAMIGAARVAEALFDGGRWERAADLYALLDDLGQWLREISLIRPAQEAWVKVAQTVAPRAAYSLYRSGRSEEAVVALERGLATLMRDELVLRQVDIDQLRRAGYGAAALAFEGAVEEWDALWDDRHFREGAPPAALIAARQRFEAARDHIRTLPGFTHFLDRPSLADILATAQDRPLVFIAYTSKGGLAFVVDTEVTAVELPRLTEKAVSGLAERYLAAYDAFRQTELAVRDDEVSAEKQRARSGALVGWLTALDKALGWLWPVAMEPVLAALKKRKITAAVLVGGGLLRLLPLGAAFTTPWWSRFLFYLRHGVEPPPLAFPRRSYVIDRVCLSTAPSAWSLLAAARVRQRHEGRGDSAVAYRWSREGKEGFEQELKAVVAAFPERHAKITDGPKQRLVAALADHAVLQFSGHGETDFADPLNGAGLYLLDDLRRRTKLTVREIIGLALNLRACILSACESGLEGGRRDLAHEAIGLPAALLQAGCAAVIAPAWTVHNRATAHLLSRFHELWREMPDDPAEALRQAQLWLRRNLRREIAADGGLNFLGEEDAAAAGAEADGQDLPPPRPIPPVIVGGAFDAVPLDHPFWWGAFACTGG